MQCTIKIKDEVNVKLEGLDLATRRTLEKKLKFFMSYAYHVPAYKLGRWDGCVSFFSIGGSTYLNLLDRLLPTIIDEGYTVITDDRRQPHNFNFENVQEDSFSHVLWPERHPAEGQPIVLRDYQVDVINKFLETPQCLQEIATGAGKTLITAALSQRVEHIGRSIVIVPNKDLVTQTEADYRNMGLDVGVYFGDRKEIGKTHTICTWQSLNIMEKRFRDGETTLSIQEFAEDVKCIMVDEVHQAKADVLKKLLTGPFANVPIRWGLTGTIPKEDHERIALEASLGTVVNSLGASELQDKGVLANCNVNVLQLQETAEYSNYQQELTYLVTDKQRLDYMASLIQKLSEDGNTLVLVDRLKAGNGLLERLGDNAVFVSGSMKSKDRKDEYDEVAEAQSKIILATYGVAAVGINIPRIFNLVLIEPGKSFVRVIQSIGRGIRKAADKDHVEIWDITSSAKFSKRHLTQRKKFYKEANYPFSIAKINYRK